MLRGIFVLCLIAGSQQLRFKEFSGPPSVEVGMDAELKCEADLDKEQMGKLFVKWWRKDKNALPKQLYQRVASNGYISTIPKNIKAVHGHEDNILILNAQPNDSSIYECELSLDLEERRNHLELYVYSKGTGPNITFYDDEDDGNVTISCEAADVTPKPDLVITIGSENLNATPLVQETEGGFYNIVVNATVSQTEIQDKDISCELFYENKNIAHPQYKQTQLYTEYEEELGVNVPITEESSVDDTTGNGPALRSMWALILATVISTRFII